jgi:hypothetical protein
MNFIQYLPGKSNSVLCEIIQDYRCDLRRKRSVAEQVFCISEYIEKKLECIGTLSVIHSFKNAYGSHNDYCTVLNSKCFNTQKGSR